MKQFLKDIFSKQCEKGDYFILSVKGPDIKWKDVPIKYGSDIDRRLNDFFKRYPPETFDLYWSPMPYSGPKRRLENALDTKFLAQDIDEFADPDTLDPKPSYIWESSPNKYQGLWELDRYIEEPEYTPFNKSLAEHIGCDDCFDFPHVYRIPGSVNHKYKNNPPVSMPDHTRSIYKPKDIKKMIGYSERKQDTQTEHTGDLTERKIYAKYSIPKKVRDLLAIDDLTGIDRSNTIWYIENSLNELGMEPNEIIHLVKNSAFNKYKGRTDEDKRLRKELDKILSGKISSEAKQSKKFKVDSFESVMANHNTFEGWLVKGFWGKRSHGMVAGMPKTYKSTLVHDLAVSVASGEPFLGKYEVLDPGPVVIVQNENADYIMKDRSQKIMTHRNLDGSIRVTKNRVWVEMPKPLPIHFINQQGFLMTTEDHRMALEEMIAEVKPVLLILDPLYLMFEGDLNSAQDLTTTLNWLLEIKKKYKTSVMLIHHYNKGGMAKGGARMAGSVFLYGWIESAWYLSKPEQEITAEDIDGKANEPSIVTMGREFRFAGNYPEIDIHLDMGDIGESHYNVDVTLSGEAHMKTKSVLDDILNLMESSNAPMSRRKIAESLGLSRTKTKEALDKLLEGKRIVPKDEGFAIYKGYGN